jgi:pyridoxamine 5'-phosphate oxidase
VKNLPELREDYGRGSLEISDVSPDPIEQFRVWFQNAVDQGLPEPNAMTLATATVEGRPSARIVLLKGFDNRGFAFFTNYRSRKGRELSANPFAALLFFYVSLERQIRVEGRIEVLSSEESDAYYLTRPIGSRLGAWASNQSEVVADRSTLDQRLAELEKRALSEPFPRPSHWGGFRVVPDVFEFWQGRHNRMHDRIRYRSTTGGWVVERLEP